MKKLEMEEVNIPKIKITSNSLPQEAYVYENFHKDLKAFIDSTIVPVDSEDNIIKYFQKDLKLKNPTNDSPKYHDSYALFRPIVSLLRIEPVILKSWVLNADSLGEGNNILIILIKYFNMKVFLICSRLLTGEYVAYYINENELTKKYIYGLI